MDATTPAVAPRIAQDRFSASGGYVATDQGARVDPEPILRVLALEWVQA